jgi:hypothetical protein
LSSRSEKFTNHIASSALAGLLLFVPALSAQQPPRPLEPMPPLLEPMPVGANSTPIANSAASDVSFHDGLLAIRTRNSTLAEVLQIIADKTGASIDIPAGSGLDRIVEQAGPGPADEVISRLLNGSPYNFVIVNSPDSPHLPTRVVLLPRGSGPHIMAEPSIVAASSAHSEPQLYGAGFAAGPEEEQEESAALPQTMATASPSAGGSDTQEVPGAVLDQMQKERLRQRQQQMQQQAAQPSPMQ